MTEAYRSRLRPARAWSRPSASALAPRAAALDGLRLGVLDNTKWNANRLLRKTAARLDGRVRLCRGQLLPQGELLEGRRPGAASPRSPRDNDIVLTAIGD